MTTWQRFRAWRRSRPFWGGLLTIMAGLAIIGSMNLELHGGTISIGQEGFPAYLIAFVLIIVGPLAWFMPAQRHFYGLVATFVAIYSLIGVNLGGYFVGMLLGLAGGGLIFAWTPSTPEPANEAQPAEADDDGTAILPVTPPCDGIPDQRPEAKDHEFHPKGRGPRHAATTFITVVMSASMLAVVVAGGRAGAASCDPVEVAPAPATQSQGPVEAIVDGIIDFFDRLLGGGNRGATPSATTSPTPSPSPTPCASPTSPATPDPEPSGSASPDPEPSGGPTTDPAPTPSQQIKVVKADQPVVGKRPSRMTGSRSTMINLVFRGVVDLPTHGGGTIRSLWFTMSRSETEDFLLHVYGKDGWDMELPSSKLTVKGDTVNFYTSRFQGRLLGLIPVDYTPESLPPPIPLPLVFFTDVDVQLVWVGAPELLAPDLGTRLVPA